MGGVIPASKSRSGRGRKAAGGQELSMNLEELSLKWPWSYPDGEPSGEQGLIAAS